MTSPPVPGFPQGRTATTTYTTASTPAAGGGNAPAGLVADVVTPGDKRTTYTYNKNGDLASVTDPGGDTTRFAYTPNGEQLPATRPDGAREETTWDYLGRPLTSTDIVRQPTQRAYTAINEYDAPGGELSRTVSPSGASESYTYDALGETTSVTDSAGNVSRFTYDMDGQLLTSTGPDGTSTRNTYDGFGQLTATSDLDADGKVLRTSRASYDRAGNPCTVTDYRGNTVTLTTDATGQITKAVQPVSESESITTTFGYDAAGNRTRFTDGRGNPFLTTYNNWGLPESEIEPATPAHPDPEDRTFTMVYDGNGRPSQSRSPGNVVIDNTYDTKGRLTKQTGKGAEAETVDHSYTYDSDDRITSIAGYEEDRNTFSYDDRGLLLSAKGPSGDSSFSYNADGAITSRTDASGTSTYGYDTAGRLKTAKEDASTGTSMTYGYDVNSNVTSVDYGQDKSRRVFSYDALERLTSDRLTSPSGKLLASTAYGYDANGNETSKTTTGVVGASTSTYTYDRANRITSWNNGTTTEQYGYDASGNRTRVAGDTYTYDARNRLTSDGHNTYGYTARGTLSVLTDESGQQTSINADAFNRIIEEGDRRYTYDGFDRVLKAENQGGGATDFAYSGAGNDIASDGYTTYSRNADGSVLGMKSVGSAASAVLVLTDLHDDVVGQFTESGEALTGSTTYSPFGKVVDSYGMIGQLGYQSGWTDPETAKVNMAARWYSPETGQFNSRDTVALNPLPNSVSANRYAYADQNPMTATDPTGHWPSFVDKAIKKAIKKVTKKVTKKVKKTVKTAWKKTKATVKKTVKKVVQKAKRVVRKAVHYVADSVKKVKRYVKRTYKTVKKVAHKVTQTVKRKVKAAAKVVKSAAKKIVKQAKKVGAAVKKAAKATANFVKQHVGTIASVAVGVEVFAGCTAGSLGVGVIGCAALAGAAANGVGYLMSDGPKTLGGLAGAVVIGGVTGAAGGAVGGAASGAVGRLLANTGGKVAQGAAMGAAGGAAEGAVGYGISCTAGQEGCSASGAAKATAVGAVAGGIFGAAASKFGRKGCTPHSFTGSTGVLMTNALTKPISQVKVGDYVLTAEPGKKKKEKHRVKAVIVTKTDRNYVDVIVDIKVGPKTIQTTKHHQFYEASRNSWTQAGDLKPGQQLQNADGEPTTIVKVKSYTAQRTTYDLSIDGLHTYHVAAGDSSVLVHNDSNSAGEGQACPIGPGSSPDSVNWPRFRETKTAAKSGGKFTLSGWSMRKTKAFEKVNVADVAAKRAEIGMPILKHNMDLGEPGRYFNSHAEKQVEIMNPGGLHTVSREMCGDCVDFFSRLASHDNQVKRVADPDGPNVFHPGGRREVLPYEND